MEQAKQIETSGAVAGSGCVSATQSRWFNSRNVLLGAAVLGLGGALFFGWDWLVAAGMASVIVAVMPCLAMCALGLCASRLGRKDAANPVCGVPPKEG